MDEYVYDVLIIGAGAAGLMAAWELAQTGKIAAIIEAKPHVGGRTYTINDNHFDLPVELGAEFVHGDLPLTKLLLEKAGVLKYKVKGDIWHNEEGSLAQQNDFIEDYSALNKKFKELREDISVADFVKDYLQADEFEETRFSLKNYVEGYYAADTHKASTFSLIEEWNNSNDDQYRIEGGYTKLVEYLYGQCKEKGVQFYLSHPVKEIQWKKDHVTVITGQNHFNSKRTVVTVSIGVLQSEGIRFSPTIQNVVNAAKKLGFGPVVKTLLQFDEPFWKNKDFTQGKDLSKLSFIFSKATIPTWWTYHPKQVAMLTGWSGGPKADKIKDLTDEEILLNALQSLSEIFGIDKALLRQKLLASHVANWVTDPYSCGGYSYEVVNGKDFQQIIKQSVEKTIYFAGEGLFHGPEIGTVEAALQTGRDTAHQLIADFKS
ncbi:MAG: flavin monoamine oxidase family protein [Flavisolibacter sp.]